MIKAYEKDGDISYSLGAFPTIELIKKRKDCLIKVIISSKLKMTDELSSILDTVKDKTETDDKSIDRISKKGNVFIMGVFKKRYESFGRADHVALVKPSDAGNLGTILRTMLGFGIKNLAIIGSDAVDEYDPKVVRASMGAIFSVNIEKFDSFESYGRVHDENRYLFMLLPVSRPLTVISPKEPYALIFGNEATGLPPELAASGQPVIIKHSQDIDSLNLPQACGIAMYEFTKKNF